MAKGATSKKKREDEKRQEPQQRQDSRQREETRQRQQRTQRETSQNNSANSRQTTRREVAPAAIPVLEERSTPRRSASGRNVASMFPESTAPQTTNIPKVEPIPTTNNQTPGFRDDLDDRLRRKTTQGIRLDAEDRIKASDASQYGAERAEEPQMKEYSPTIEKGRKNAQRATTSTGQNRDYQGGGGGRSFGRPTDYEQYENLMQNGEFEDDIAKLSQINTGSALGVSANPDLYAKGVTGGKTLDEYYTYLENKYNLSADELDDLALTYKSELNNEQSAKIAQKAQEFGEEHPALGSIASLPVTLANTVEGVNNVLVGGITGDERRLSRMASGTKQGFREGAKENIDSNGGKVAYDLGMGVADLGAGVATGQAPAILAGNTANEAMLGAVDRGQNVRKSALYGAGSGVLDYITNTIGLDKAKSLGMDSIAQRGVRGLLKRAGIAAATEAGENLIQDLGQTFFDELINGKYSEIRTALTQRLQNGESVEEAYRETYLDWVKDRGMSLATGALMGGAMFGGTALANNVKGGLLNNALKAQSEDVWNRVNEYEQNRLNPAEMARQNEADIPTVEAEQAQALDTIQKLGEQVPDITEQNVNPANNANQITNINVDPITSSKHTPEEISLMKEYGLSFIPGDYKDALRSGEISRADVLAKTTPEFQDALARLSRGEAVSEDEIMALPEVRYAVMRIREGQIDPEDPSRFPYQQEMADKYYQRGSAQFDSNGKVQYTGDIERGKKVFFVTGLPASGKSSTLVDKISNEFKARVLDSDDIKYDHEDFDNGFGGNYVHPESKKILKMVRQKAMGNEENLVIPIIGGDDLLETGGLRDKIKEFQDKGWEVSLCQNDLPSSKSAGRALSRYATDGRYIPPKVLLGYGDDPHNNYMEIIERGEQYGLKPLSGYARVDNDVAEGQRAITKEFGGELSRLFGRDDAESQTVGGNVQATTENGTGLAQRLSDEGQPTSEAASSFTEGGVNFSENGGEIPATPVNPRPPETGQRRAFTNTGVKSGIIDPYDLKNNPVTKRDAEYVKHKNADVLSNATENVGKYYDMLAEQYASGTREVNQDQDLDQAMLILNDNRTSRWSFDSIMRNLAEHGTKAGQFIQAFAKWANTATGAIAKAVKIDVDATKKWATRNRQRVEANNRVAKAINLIGVPESDVQRTPLTHEQLRDQIRKTIDDAFGDRAKEFGADDIEYLTILAETKKIPVRKITQELEHKLETGEWFTIDESLPVKVERAIKNGQISNMLDRIVNGETPKTAREPEAYGRFLKKIRNSLQDENIGLADEFDDLDVYFIGKMIQERVPKATIEDELRHRIETGEWYTIDESIQAPKPTNQKLQNAFKQMRGENIKSEPQQKTFEQIRNEVRNTLEKNGELNNYSDSDIEYLSHLVEQGASTSDIASAMNAKAATGRFGISEDTQTQVNKLFEYARHYPEDSRQFVEAQAEAYRLLAEEVAPKASPLEKFDAWRYMAMLGNPKTMLRNYVGNKMFGAVTGMSNNLAAAMEHGVDYIYNRKTGQHIQRTKEFLNPFKDKALIDGAAKFAEDTSWRQVEGSKYEKLDRDSLKHNRSVFKSDVMRLAEKAVNEGVSDTNAVIKKFSTSMAGYMKANGLDSSAFEDALRFDALERYSQAHPEDMTDAERAEMERTRPIAAEMEKARQYALKQAEYATFHEDNKIANVLSKWSRTSREEGVGLGSLLIEGTVPFKKTPANILRSGAEYSPFGALKSIAETGKLIYENTGSRKGNLADEYTRTNRLTGKEKTVQRTLASDVIDSWSKTLTGTALTYLGYYLFNKGILTSSDKGEKYQDQLEGKGNYAININGHTYTLDWAAPGVMPLLIGAEVNKVLKANGRLDEEWYSNPDKWLETINALLDPLLETSMMSGVKDTLTNAANEVRYNEDNALGGIIGSAVGNMVTGYATQAIPTLSGQIARTIDPVRRTTDTVNEGILGTIEKQARRVANKIPFLSMRNPEYRDAYGRGQLNGPYGYNEGDPLGNIRAFEGNLTYQMLSPGYYSKINTTDADRLGRDLFNATEIDPVTGKERNIEGVTGDDSVFADWRSTKKIAGEKLNPEELQTFREEMGQANYALREGIYNSEWYNNLDTKQQRDLLVSLNSIADKIGQYSVRPDSVTVSGALKTYLDAGGGEEGIKAIIDGMQTDAILDDLGISKTSKMAGRINEAIASGNQDEADFWTQAGDAFAASGLPTRASSVFEERGHDSLPDMTAEQYFDAYRIADANGNGKVTQDEMIAALPKLGVKDDQTALNYWKGFLDSYTEGSTQIPHIMDDGSWEKQSPNSTSEEKPTQEITNESVNQAQEPTESFEDALNRRRQERQGEITTLDPDYQPNGQYNTIDDVWTTMKGAGLSTSGASPYWKQASSYGASPQQFYEYYNAIDSALGEPNGGISMDEWAKYLNDNGLPYDKDMEIIRMMYNTRWTPLRYEDETWYSAK